MSATPPSGRDDQRDVPGRIMSGEMAEQPAMLRRILEQGAPRIHEVAAEIAARKPRFVLLTARGTSDNAALMRSTCWRSGSACPAGSPPCPPRRRTGPSPICGTSW
ncbi:Glutamine-fructose-6-phosphate transaminase OS=Streptomyces microflavus OX=1919 GN=Smic_55980 PE=4 SV=1 [Streptomyces microflavus]